MDLSKAEIKEKETTALNDTTHKSYESKSTIKIRKGGPLNRNDTKLSKELRTLRYIELVIPWFAYLCIVQKYYWGIKIVILPILIEINAIVTVFY
jgi:hypothetical protein